MKAIMTHATRAELANALRSRYKAASGKAKRRILEEFIAAAGYHEKSAIRVLKNAPVAKVRQTRRRPSLYDEAARAALIVLWEASVFNLTKLLVTNASFNSALHLSLWLFASLSRVLHASRRELARSKPLRPFHHRTFVPSESLLRFAVSSMYWSDHRGTVSAKIA